MKHIFDKIISIFKKIGLKLSGVEITIRYNVIILKGLQ